MKKKGLLLFVLVLIVVCAAGCGQKTELDPDHPVTLTVWHVYGEQADSPMNALIDEFNSSIGKEKGIVINTTLMSNASNIGEKLLDAQAKTPGSLDMPDLFFCHSSNADELGSDNLIDWNEYFTEDEMANYVPAFVEDGIVDNSLAVFPIAKSTHLLFLNGTEFERFSDATGVAYDDLSTWEGFFDTAEKYYKWSGGKAFCAFDYLIRSVELNAFSMGASPDSIYSGNWYNFKDPNFKKSWLQFSNALVKGHITVSDMYSNTQVMTGDVAGGIGSSASILYYNDTVTYPDNTTEPVNLHILPIPQSQNGSAVETQAGVGLCALKTTSQKAEAAAVFARWLTESQRNLKFAAETGYMPVSKEAYSKISSYDFSSEEFRLLYKAFSEVQESYTILREPMMNGYYNKVYKLYDILRNEQAELISQYNSGQSADSLCKKTWKQLQNIE